MADTTLNPMELDTLFNYLGDALAYCEAIRMATNDVTIPKPQANAIQRILVDIDQCVGMVRGEIGERLNIAEDAERMGRIAS